MNIQTVCKIVGAFLIMISVSGIFFPNVNFFPHTILHALAFFGLGIALTSSGMSRQKIRAQNAALDIGVVMFLLGLGGFILGTRGGNNFEIIPRVLVLQTYHHIVNLLFGAILLTSYYLDRKREDAFSRLTVYLQARKAR